MTRITLTVVEDEGRLYIEGEVTPEQEKTIAGALAMNLLGHAKTVLDRVLGNSW